MADKIKNGRYVAKLLDYGIGVSKTGNAQALVMFKYKDNDGDSHDLTWFGSFHPNAAEFTCKSLVTLDFKGDDPSVLADGIKSGVLNANKEVELVVEWETYNGKENARIKYINEVGASKFQNKLSKPEAELKFTGMNLGAVFAEIRQNKRVDTKVKNHAPGADNQGVDVDEKIGF